ncbi:MAG: hypothetical protein BWY31_04157 [Lentisphaerae bacterium ADurb.Bin242]|nr:MAG: hypothetical protein BWY31_04157 [Lentisphaerae bacterium ADurb.Bin242]
MKKLLFAMGMLCVLFLGAGEAEVGKTVAHSVADWDAAGNGVTPEQGFRNWYFGYYDQVDKPETFQLIPQKGKQYWGDGNFTCGMISRDTIAWAGGSKKHNIVRRWIAPEDGNYMVEMEGTHTLKVNGEPVTWPRKLYIYLNSKLQKTFSFPGKTVCKEAFAVPLKKGDKLDFAAQSWGGGLRITILIIKQEKGLAVAINGTSPYQIVIPDNDPGTISMKAAKLLQRILKESTGAELPVVCESKAGNQPSFFIGNTKKAAAEGIGPEKLQEHEYLKKVSGQNVFLAGVNSETEVRGKKAYRQGDYKAVCSFLEDELGVRFLLPGKEGEFIPKHSSFTVPAGLNQKHTPPFQYHITSHPIKIRRDAYEPYMTASNFIDLELYFLSLLKTFFVLRRVRRDEACEFQQLGMDGILVRGRNITCNNSCAPLRGDYRSDHSNHRTAFAAGRSRQTYPVVNICRKTSIHRPDSVPCPDRILQERIQDGIPDGILADAAKPTAGGFRKGSPLPYPFRRSNVLG